MNRTHRPGQAFLLLVALFVLSTVDTRAQRTTLTPYGGTVRTYTERDGLPGTGLKQVVRTADGYLWLTTNEGIVRFNGQDFERIGDDHGVPEMSFLHYDRHRDELWFADTTALVRYDGQASTRYAATDGYRLAGLPGKIVTAMHRDRQGALWIGTGPPGTNRLPGSGGLTRLQDNRFTVFDSTSFPLDNVFRFYETTGGDVWVVPYGRRGADGSRYNRAYPARYEPEREAFEMMGPEQGYPLEGTFDIVEDNRGDLWFLGTGTIDIVEARFAGAGVARYRDGRFETFPTLQARFDGGDVKPNQALYDARRDALYLTLSRDYGDLRGWTAEETAQSVLVYRGGQWSVEQIVAPEDLAARLSLQPDTRQYFGYSLALGLDGQLYAHMASGENPYTSWKPWYVRGEEGWRFHGATESPWRPPFWRRFTAQVPLPGGGFLLEAPDGFSLYYGPRSRHLTRANGLLGDDVETLYMAPPGGDALQSGPYPAGPVWLGYAERDSYQEPSRGRGVTLWDGHGLRSYTTRDGLSNNHVEQVIQDRENTFWLATYGGVTRAVPTDTAFRFMPISTDDGTPYFSSRLMQRKNGEILAYNHLIEPATSELPEAPFFLGTYEGGQFVRMPFPFPESLRHLPWGWMGMYEDTNGRLWAAGSFSATESRRREQPMLRVHTEEGWRSPPEAWGVPEGAPQPLGALSSGDYFLIGAGIYRFDGTRFHDLARESEGLGALLRRIDPAETLQASAVRRDTLYVPFLGHGILALHGSNHRFFDRSDGLPTLSIDDAVRLPDEDLIFATQQGALLYDGATFQLVRDDLITTGTIDDATRDARGNMLLSYVGKGITITEVDTTRPPLRVSALTADTLRFGKDATPTLNHRHNNVRLHFAALDYQQPEGLRYSYRLDGLDEDWSAYAPERSATYTNLPPGDYRFQVRAVNASGVASEEAVYSFTVEPPWWRTWWAYTLYALLLLAGVFAVDRVQRRRLIARERERARERELEQAREIERAYTELKATQQQLVHSEKMASLGALTAGIAHEIKNPLNFVNNFAALSRELVDELENETDPEEVEALLADLKMNAAKIEEHGQRADAIVRSMMQHARGGDGQRESVDLNTFVDEYVDLAYHGKRAQVPDFNAEIVRDYGEDAGSMEIVPQEMGRVLINLLSNAFDAVRERAARVNGQYEPRVRVSTCRKEDSVEIRVEDNGPGIPEAVRDRIFEPFFTTKPTGSGTGLGLSMSFDIVTQGHGGTLAAESEPGEGAAFVVTLPEASGIENPLPQKQPTP